MHRKKFVTTIIILLNFFYMAPALCLSREAAAEEPSIIIEDIAICRGVIEKKPVEPGDIFPDDVNKLFCFSRVVGAQEDTEVIHAWYYKERMISRVALSVKSSDWRTHSSKTILPEYSGEWKVEILSKDGSLLKQVYFVIH